jgi:hypothetical protein
MNIFILSKYQKQIAQDHCNKHVCKMIVEYAQILCSAHHITHSTYSENSDNPKLYKLTHKNHPCCVWIRTNIANYKWLAILAFELCEQYTIRYRKKHKTQDLIEHLCINYPDLPQAGLAQITPFVQAMPVQFRQEDPIKAYRTYYAASKFRFAKWKIKQPDWWDEYRKYVIENKLEVINLVNDGIE